jgi:hypothetical protein
VGGAVAGQRFGSSEADQLSRLRAGPAGEQAHRPGGAEREELLDDDAQHVAESARVAAEADVVPGIHDATEEGDHQPTAVPDVVRQIRRGGIADEIEAGSDDQPIPAEIGPADGRSRS